MVQSNRNHEQQTMQHDRFYIPGFWNVLTQKGATAMTRLELQPVEITDYETGERYIIKRQMNLKTKAKMKKKAKKILLLTITAIMVIAVIVCSLIALGDNTDFHVSVKCIVAVYAMTIFWILPFGYANKFFR